ncbi:MAG: YggT family protein [Limnothrix sp.]
MSYNNSDPQRPADPNRPGHDYTDATSDADVAKREAVRLRREQQRIDVVRQKVFFTRIENSIYFLVGMLETLLFLRFFLRLSGANPQNMFAQFIYGLSGPFVAPFSTLFISPTENTGATIGQNIFDINLIIAIIVYAILCLLATWLVRYVYRQVSPTSY